MKLKLYKNHDGWNAWCESCERVVIMTRHWNIALSFGKTHTFLQHLVRI